MLSGEKTAEVGMTTVEIDNVLATPELQELVEAAEQTGSLRYAELAEAIETLHLDPLEVDAVYRPTAAEMYPPGASTRVHVHGVTDGLEGAARPRHFEGVATVVTKLLAAVAPDRAYFGQKDAQQVAVVNRLARDLDLGVEIRVVPTVREPDGLALSSRNVYLGPEERKAARSISAALREAAAAYSSGERDPVRLRARIAARLTLEPLVHLEYAELVDPATFQKPGTLAVIAARVGETRLIDNHDVTKPFPG